MRSVTELRAVCAQFPGSVETFPFGPTALVFKVGGVPLGVRDDERARVSGVFKMYALTDIGSDPLTLSLKCDPARGEALREVHAAITPGYHLNKRHWISVRLGEVPDDLVAGLLRGSYDLVRASLPRGVRDAVGAK